MHEEAERKKGCLDGWKYMQKIPFKRLLYLVFITDDGDMGGGGEKKSTAIYGRIKCECHEILGEDYDAGRM
jgi:hypothetical protein